MWRLVRTNACSTVGFVILTTSAAIVQGDQHSMLLKKKKKKKTVIKIDLWHYNGCFIVELYVTFYEALQYYL